MRTCLPRAAGVCVLAVSLACGDPRGAGEPASDPGASAPDGPVSTVDNNVVLRFGVITREEPRLTVAGAQPLIDYLDTATPYRVELRMGRSSEDVELDVGMQDLVTFLEERHVEVAPLGVLSFCLADERFGATILVQTLGDDGEPVERAAVITSPSSGITGLEELDGKRVALGPSHSMLSHVMAMHTFESAGISPVTTHFDTERAVIDAVVRGEHDAGVVPEHFVDGSVRVVHLSIPIPSRPLVVRSDLPADVQQSLRAALLGLDRASASDWDRIFRNGFAPPSAVDYRPVRRILNEQGARCTESCHEPVHFKQESE